jgi:hypothetical protein
MPDDPAADVAGVGATGAADAGAVEIVAARRGAALTVGSTETIVS